MVTWPGPGFGSSMSATLVVLPSTAGAVMTTAFISHLHGQFPIRQRVYRRGCCSHVAGARRPPAGITSAVSRARLVDRPMAAVSPQFHFNRLVVNTFLFYYPRIPAILG